jgi:FkbM family methyltransferase
MSLSKNARAWRSGLDRMMALPTLAFVITQMLCFILVFRYGQSKSKSTMGDVKTILVPNSTWQPFKLDFSETIACKNLEGSERGKYHSDCYFERFLRSWHGLSPGTDKTFMDVGVNKGFVSVLLLDIWTPEVGINPASLGVHWRSLGVKKYCAPCPSLCILKKIKKGNNQLKENLDRETNGERTNEPVTLFMYEPSSLTTQTLNDFFYQMAVKYEQKVGYVVERAAISNECTIANFPITYPGNMFGSLDVYRNQTRFSKSYKNLHFVRTRVTSVDEEAARANIKNIDYLKIDTEGFDRLVILGSIGMISRGAIKVLSFEYLKDSENWPENSLLDLLKLMHSYGYQCFHPEAYGLVQIKDLISCNAKILTTNADFICIQKNSIPMQALLHTYKYD